MAAEVDQVSYVRLEQKGRGRALKSVWQTSDAEVLAYMDVDLSTDLAALLPLVAPLISGHSDLAIGTRLSRHSRVVRGPKREFISRSYNLILRTTLAARFSDAQCGFKAIRADVAAQLMPLIEDTGWFFDTELLVLAQRAGLRVHEVPVDWVDDPDSRVDIVATALDDLRGVARLSRGFLTGSIPTAAIRSELGRGPLTVNDQSGAESGAGGGGESGAESGQGTTGGQGATGGFDRFGAQLIRFLAVGVGSTIAFALLYLLLRVWLTPQAANLTALLTTAIANTAANRRLTFGVTGSTHVVRHHLQGFAVFLLGLGLTAGSLAALGLLAPGAPRAFELTLLVLANLVTTVVRFLALRLWVFASHRAPSTLENNR